MAFVLIFPMRPNWSLPSMTSANSLTKISRQTLLCWIFPKLSTLSCIRNSFTSWNSMASKDPCTSGLWTSSHSTRCEWWLMASSPVRHPWTLEYPRALCLVPCCSCAISTIFSVLSNHKCISHRWMSSLQGDSLSPRLHHPATRPTAVGDMGRTVGDEVQHQEMLHHESTQQVIPPILPR